MRTVFFIVIAFAASWALLNPHFFYIHDFLHAARVAEMARGLQSGQFPVIWSSNFGYGYGMPLYLFYAPLPFFIGSLFFLLGMPGMLVVQLLFLLATLGTMVGGYLLCREIWGKHAGIVGAALLTLAPYRALNIFVRGALSESWGYMAALIALWGIMLIIKKKKWGPWVLWAGLVILFLSHNISVLLFAPFIVAFFCALLLIQKETLRQKFKMLLAAAISAALAFGSSLFYLLPAYIEKDSTHIDTILSGYFDYRLHFVYLRQLITPFWGYGGSSWGVTDGISFFLGFPFLLLFVVTIGVIFYLFFKHKDDIEQTSFGLLVSVLVLAAAALFMTTGHAQHVWEAVGILATVQFPWRFLGPASLFISLMVGALFTLIPPTKRNQASVIAVASIIFCQWQYFKPQQFGGVKDTYFYTQAQRIQQEASPVLPDYIPKTFRLPPPEKYIPIECAPAQECTRVQVQRNTTRWHITSTVTEATRITLGIADFAGWKVKEGTQDIPHVTTEDGLIEFMVQPGTHAYLVNFGSTPLRTTTRIISAVSFSAVLVSAIRLYRRKHHA